MKEDEDVELSPELSAGLGRLPREVEPSRGFEPRLLTALRARGLIVAGGRLASRYAGWSSALRIAAALAIFAAGVALGHRLGGAPAPIPEPVLAEANARQLAALVQRTGSAHAAALGDIAARIATASPEETALAREVAMSSLRATLWQMVLLDPGDQVAARMLRELERPAPGTPPSVRVTAEPLVVSF